jgi:hypothetical protein
MNKKYLLYATAGIALLSLGYYFYEKRRIDKLNAKVDSLQTALNTLSNL